MSLRNGARLFQVHSGARRSQTFISKLSSNSKFWLKSGGVQVGLCGAGWISGGQIAWKQILSNSHHHLDKSKLLQFNHQCLRGIRSGKTPSSSSTKTHRTFLLTSLEDSGTKMSGITDLFIKPATFTVLIVGGSFIGSTIWQYETHRNKNRRTIAFSPSTWIAETSKKFEIRNAIHSWWEKESAAGKIFWPICAINLLIFAAWHTPGLTTRMVTYFTSTPASRAICWPMLFSTFSHYSILHLGANMFVLHSFIPAAVSLLGTEQFIGTYLAAGVVSSFGSHLHKLLIGSSIPSLGASGAIMGILAFVCMKMPDIQLGIIFLPGISFSADTAIKCILAVDTVGLLAGWRIMDHAAHLSGAMCGIGLMYFETKVTSARDKIMQLWHKLRSS